MECPPCDPCQPAFTVCPPPPGAPCVVPIIPPGVPSYPVNPCQPDSAMNSGPCENVYVTPIQQGGTPCIIIPPKPRRCKYIQPQRPKSYAPIRYFQPPDLKMSDNTIYRKSYLPVENDRNPAFHPENNLCVGEGPFSQDTVNKMSYKGHKDVLPPCPVYPCNHKLLGDGPMQDITTQKHDYVPKPQQKSRLYIPPTNLHSSECPLSDKTTNRLSYMPVDTAKARVNAFYPTPAIEKACGPFEKNTVHKMSYMPWEPQEPVDKPWAAKQKFAPPTLRMSGNTVNKLSYMAPGTYVECDECDPDCIPCPDDPCDPSQEPNSGCCQPCCCPKAAC